jgi:RNA polymerase sigma-70 factor (ECF subfamily)
MKSGPLAAEPTAPSAEAPADAGVLDADVLALIDRAEWRPALDTLMGRYGVAVYRFCRQMLRDDALVDDVHQQVFVQAYRDLPRFQQRSQLRTWLFGIARHRCLDAIKIQGRRDRRFPLDDEPGAGDAAPGPSPLDILSLAELSGALETCLDELAPATKSAVLLRYREGLPFDQMAGMFGEKAGTLQARVARALPVLRRCLERRLREGEAA